MLLNLDKSKGKLPQRKRNPNEGTALPLSEDPMQGLESDHPSLDLNDRSDDDDVFNSG